jgi:hypothetical protein
MRVIPALFCALMMFAGILLGPVNDRVTIVLTNGPFGVSPAMAAPPEEKLPELSKPQLHREKTKLEKAVDQAAAMLLQGKLPASEDGVRFALWLYGDKGDVAYLDVATKMARELKSQELHPMYVPAALYWVAQAGGPTLAEAREMERKTANYARVEGLSLKLAVVAGTRDPDEIKRRIDLRFYGDPIPEDQPESGHFQDHFPTTASLRAEWEWLQVHNELSQLLGLASINSSLGIVARNIVDRFLDTTTPCFVDAKTGGPADLFHHDNVSAAFSIWETGLLIGDARLREVGRRALENDIEPALQDPKSTAITGLAAGRMSRHHLQLAIIGDPEDPAITAFRQAAYFMFEPSKVILNLDPKTDSARMAELMYPADVAPAMFVCVETLCSPPIKDPAELEKQVAEIKKLAAEVQQ